jgi:hypothetical protein
MGQASQTSPSISQSNGLIYDPTRSLDPDAMWTPPHGVTMHNGEPIPETMAFFEPPPAEIGEIVSAYSTVKRGKRYSSLLSRWLWIGLGNACLAALIIVIGSIGQMGHMASAMVMAVVSVIFVGIPVGFVFTLIGEFRQSVTYVGRHGLFKALSPRNGKVSKREQFLFASASDLYVAIQNNYVNGVYSGSQFTFTWKDHQGRKVYKINGTYSSSTGNPAAKNLLHFARAAEFVWSNHLLELVKPELESEGKVLFRANGKRDSVSIGPGFLEFFISGKEHRITVEEIGQITLGSGWLNIRHKDVKWFSGKGKFAFNYGSFANARLFLLLLDKLCGYKFE